MLLYIYYIKCRLPYINNKDTNFLYTVLCVYRFLHKA